MLQTTSSNTVQSIRAFQPQMLKQEASRLAHHFLYVDLSETRSRNQVLRDIARGFCLPVSQVKTRETFIIS